MLTVLFDGLAYGMVLFVLASGLSVTMGLMNFVNLAHGAFAMAGGYATYLLVNRLGLPFLLALPLAFVTGAILGFLLERTLYVRVYSKNALEQVLFTVGLVYMSMAVADFYMGSPPVFIHLPQALTGQVTVLHIGLNRYSLFLIGVCGLLTLVLQHIVAATRFGSRLRAAVDDARVANGLGINVNRTFVATFVVGCGLAGLGGALGAQILSLDPIFPLKYMVYFLIVVAAGGTSSVSGPFLAALLLGIADVAGKYYVPTFGAFVIYTFMIIILIVRPQGLISRGAAR